MKERISNLETSMKSLEAGMAELLELTYAKSTLNVTELFFSWKFYTLFLLNSSLRFWTRISLLII